MHMLLLAVAAVLWWVGTIDVGARPLGYCNVSVVAQAGHAAACTLGRSFGCFSSNNSMWVAGDCRGVFACNAGADVICPPHAAPRSGLLVCHCAVGQQLWQNSLETPHPPTAPPPPPAPARVAATDGRPQSRIVGRGQAAWPRATHSIVRKQVNANATFVRPQVCSKAQYHHDHSGGQGEFGPGVTSGQCRRLTRCKLRKNYATCHVDPVACSDEEVAWNWMALTDTGPEQYQTTPPLWDERAGMFVTDRVCASLRPACKELNSAEITGWAELEAPTVDRKLGMYVPVQYLARCRRRRSRA